VTAGLLGDAPLLADDPATVWAALRREGWVTGPSNGGRSMIAQDPDLQAGAWHLRGVRWLVVDCVASGLFAVEVTDLHALARLVLAPVGPDLTRLSRSPSGGWTAWWSSPDGLTSADLRLPPGVTAPPGQLAYAPPSPAALPATRHQPQSRGRHRWITPLVPARPLPRRVLNQFASTTTGRHRR
jgi:hypothetical protein